MGILGGKQNPQMVEGLLALVQQSDVLGVQRSSAGQGDHWHGEVVAPRICLRLQVAQVGCQQLVVADQRTQPGCRAGLGREARGIRLQEAPLAGNAEAADPRLLVHQRALQPVRLRLGWQDAAIELGGLRAALHEQLSDDHGSGHHQDREHGEHHAEPALDGQPREARPLRRLPLASPGRVRRGPGRVRRGPGRVLPDRGFLLAGLGLGHALAFHPR